MNFNEFKELIAKKIASVFPDHNVEETKIEKMQDQSYKGLVVWKEGERFSTAINIEGFYQKFQHGESIDDIFAEVIDAIRVSPLTVGSIPMDLADYDQLKEKLYMQMVPIAGNEDMLSKVPHKVILDLAIVYRFLLHSDEQENASLLITNNYCDAYHIDPSELEKEALMICKKNHPLIIRNLASIMFGIPESAIPDEAVLWCVSNDSGNHGASVIAYPDALETIARKLNKGFWLIPSSVHEFLVAPDDAQIPAAELDRMVAEVNLDEVAPDERLTNHGYHYDKDLKLLESASDYEARISIKQEHTDHV